MDERLGTVSRALDYHFRQPELLEEALTHPSALAARRRAVAFERLEFLGDRVLGLVVADMLYRHFAAEPEGDLARRQSALVQRDTLARVARDLGLDEALLLARGEGQAAGRANPAMLADACEALLGAVYADGGLEAAARIIRRHWRPLMAETPAPPRDAKTALQEWAQGRGHPLPVYTILTREGPAHEPSFLIEVSVSGEEPAQGQGKSKRAAEQAAATALLARLTA